MKIGFDAKRAAQNRTGLGNYSRFVLRILSQYMPEHSYHLYVPSEKRMPFLTEIPTISALLLHFPPSWISKKLKSIWRTWGVSSDIKQEGITLYHGLSNELPLSIQKGGCKSIVTIHDLIFLRAPHYYSTIDSFIYNYKFKKACQLADCIIAVSEFTRQDIISYYGIDPKKIEVVYQGCDRAFAIAVSETKKQEVAEKYSLPSHYLLYVGTIEERKNLLLIAQSLKEAPVDVRVVAVGKRTPYQAEVEAYLAAHGLTERVTFLNSVPFDDLPTLYQMAHLFVYPSRIEGFGIPLLEALNSEVPAIGCTGSCLEEAGGPDSIYVSPDSPQELAHAITKVWKNDSLRAEMVEGGKKYATHFSDKLLAEKLMAVYKKVVDVGA
ncbi:MAG: glycosyltransferase family 4 protein [Phocaeicola sp.]